jgi:hypothetical protein
MSGTKTDAFTDFLKRIVAVPKDEIDEQEEAYQRKRKMHDDRSYPREIAIPPKREKQA